jgi:CO/xanthine dehydrogenase FAD-binding subunit
MKPPPFRYIRATDLPHTFAVLDEHGDETKILAGGQSLMPMMNFRLLQPAIVLDINHLPELRGITAIPDGVRVGAMTRHVETAGSALLQKHFPIVTHAISHVAHHTVRNRGTFGGSLAHADPAAELPMLAVLLQARIVARSASGERTIDAADFFVSALSTSLSSQEVVMAVDLPFLPAATGWGFEEFARRHGDYALASVAVTLRASEGRASDVRIAMMGVGNTPLRAPAAEDCLNGRTIDDSSISDAVAAVRDAIEPNTDLNASAGYRRHLAGILAGRAVAAAWQRAQALAR